MKCSILSFVAVPLLLAGCDNKDAFIQQTMDNMAYVQGGSFDMGDFCPKVAGYSCGMGGALPVHKVVLGSYYISKYKVIYKDYDVYTKERHLSELKVIPALLDIYPELRSLKRPAVANWQLSREYCQWLGNKTGLPIDLPTEAQWEYAARNRGQDVLYATDNGKFSLDVNVPGTKTIIKNTGIHAPYLVGKYPPTPLGLYDMGTDSPEWVYDWYQKDWYKISPEKNPTGPADGVQKVVRGIFVGDSREQGALNPSAVTTSRAGYDPLLKDPVPPDELLNKYHGDYKEATDEYNRITTDPYKVAEKGFGPYVTFRCVINASSLPDKYKH
jgi:formylglycine-generating enzyme required for sulfatase activity